MGTKFDFNEISSILKLLKENDVTEFKLERESDRLWLRRGQQEVQQVVAYAPQPAPTAQPQSVYPAPAASPQASVAPVISVAAEPAKSSFHEVKSPMVGTFYRRPAVDAAPFVEVGDTVKKGQTLCIVEAMKLMNEIQSDRAGKIVEICLQDGQMSEYGEVLFRIDPS